MIDFDYDVWIFFFFKIMKSDCSLEMILGGKSRDQSKTLSSLGFLRIKILW